jgi:hypothetical protein
MVWALIQFQPHVSVNPDFASENRGIESWLCSPVLPNLFPIEEPLK